jgi:hypothetical protein
MPVFKVVIDTNVFVSYFWGGNPKKVIDLWMDGELTLLISAPIIDEIGRTLIELGVAEEKIAALCEMLLMKSDLIMPKCKFRVVREDPEDNKFAECAVEGNADYLITGDNHLLKLKRVVGTRIVNPSEFLKIHNEHKAKRSDTGKK